MTTLDGLTVHRFPIDPHDAIAHGETVREILEVDGSVTPEVEERYLRHSIHSAALIDALRRGNFDAIVAGPYLFGLSADVAQAFPERTLLVPCFHDEPLARLTLWPRLYCELGGILYHTIRRTGIRPEPARRQSSECTHRRNLHLTRLFGRGKGIDHERDHAPVSSIAAGSPCKRRCRYCLTWAKRYQQEGGLTGSTSSSWGKEKSNCRQRRRGFAIWGR